MEKVREPRQSRKRKDSWKRRRRRPTANDFRAFHSALGAACVEVPPDTPRQTRKLAPRDPPRDDTVYGVPSAARVGEIERETGINRARTNRRERAPPTRPSPPSLTPLFFDPLFFDPLSQPQRRRRFPRGSPAPPPLPTNSLGRCGLRRFAGVCCGSRGSWTGIGRLFLLRFACWEGGTGEGFVSYSAARRMMEVVCFGGTYWKACRTCRRTARSCFPGGCCC